MNLLKTIFHRDVEAIAERAKYAAWRETACTSYADLFPVILPFLEIYPKSGIKRGVSFLIQERLINEAERQNAERAFRAVRRSQETKQAVKRQRNYRKSVTA